MAGAYIPFPATRAERERTRDPRQSIAERYATRTDYLKKIQDVATRLATDRYILQMDVPAIVQEAGAHWDAVMGRPTTTTRGGAR
jgi:Alpha/beta hydrolase domain